MASLTKDADVKDETSMPITQTEMRILVEPLQRCLWQMENKLQEISSALEPGKPVMLFKVEEEMAAAAVPLTGHGCKEPFAASCKPNTSMNLCASDPSKSESAGVEKNIASSSNVWTGEDKKETQEEDALDACTANLNTEQTEAMEKHEINQVIAAFQQGTHFKITFADKVAMWLMNVYQKWSKIEEPERSGGISHIINSSIFETACQIAITLNSGLVAYASDWQMRHIGKPEPQSLGILESCFVMIFLVELILRLWAHGFYFFVNSDMEWNIFDFLLVSISMVDFVFTNIVHAEANTNLGFMRLLRVLKLARIFRSFRSFRFFRALAVLLESFQRSCISLFWGFVMLALVLYCFSLLFMQALVEYLMEGLAFDYEIDADTRIAIESNFGTLSATILTLYKSVTGGDDWGFFYDLIAETGWAYGVAFVFFTFFFLFALFNILTGSLVEKALSSAKPDRTDLIVGERKRLVAQKQQFMELFQLMDTSHDGHISWKEFQKFAENPDMFAYMASIGVEIHDVEFLFSSVGARQRENGDLKNGEITIEHFVEGCMHMKGAAMAIDMQRQLFEMNVMHQDLMQYQASMTGRWQALERLVIEGLTSVKATHSQLEQLAGQSRVQSRSCNLSRSSSLRL